MQTGSRARKSAVKAFKKNKRAIAQQDVEAEEIRQAEWHLAEQKRLVRKAQQRVQAQASAASSSRP